MPPDQGGTAVGCGTNRRSPKREASGGSLSMLPGCSPSVAGGVGPGGGKPGAQHPDVEPVAHGSAAAAPAASEQWVATLKQFTQSARLMFHPVPHFKQLFSWDCGLACAVMAIRAVGHPQQQCDYSVLRQLCPTTSIWTIDLAHLLRQFGLDVWFTTVTLGPNPAFYNESFYLAHMQDDERRVSRLFHEAAAAGIHLQQRSVTWQELAAHLVGGDALVLLLIDKRKLDPWTVAADMCLPYALCGMDLGYAGHYILLVGWDAAAGQFLVMDPATDGRLELRVSPAVLDAARCAFGTDEDVLVVRHPALRARAVVVGQPPLAPQPTAAPPALQQQQEDGSQACQQAPVAAQQQQQQQAAVGPQACQQAPGTAALVATSMPGGDAGCSCSKAACAAAQPVMVVSSHASSPDCSMWSNCMQHQQQPHEQQGNLQQQHQHQLHDQQQRLYQSSSGVAQQAVCHVQDQQVQQQIEYTQQQEREGAPQIAQMHPQHAAVALQQPSSWAWYWWVMGGYSSAAHMHRAAIQQQHQQHQQQHPQQPMPVLQHSEDVTGVPALQLPNLQQQQQQQACLPSSTGAVAGSTQGSMTPGTQHHTGSRSSMQGLAAWPWTGVLFGPTASMRAPMPTPQQQAALAGHSVACDVPGGSPHALQLAHDCMQQQKHHVQLHATQAQPHGTHAVQHVHSQPTTCADGSRAKKPRQQEQQEQGAACAAADPVNPTAPPAALPQQSPRPSDPAWPQEQQPLLQVQPAHPDNCGTAASAHVGGGWASFWSWTPAVPQLYGPWGLAWGTPTAQAAHASNGHPGSNGSNSSGNTVTSLAALFYGYPKAAAGGSTGSSDSSSSDSSSGDSTGSSSSLHDDSSMDCGEGPACHSSLMSVGTPASPRAAEPAPALMAATVAPAGQLQQPVVQ